MATHCLLASDDSFSSKSNDVIRYVISPQFSMAPAAKSGMAIKSGSEENDFNSFSF